MQYKYPVLQHYWFDSRNSQYICTAYLNQLPEGTLFIGFKFSDLTCAHLPTGESPVSDFTSNILLLCLRVSYVLFYGLFSSFVSLLNFICINIFFWFFVTMIFPSKEKKSLMLTFAKLRPPSSASAYVAYDLFSRLTNARAAYSNINIVKLLEQKAPSSIRHSQSTSHHLSPGFLRQHSLSTFRAII